MNLRISLLPMWVALVGCSPQVDSEYRGEPLATLGGLVASSAELRSLPDVNAAIVWLSFHGDGDEPEPTFIGERVAVEGKFPAGFSFKLFTPPPPKAEFSTKWDFCIDEDSVSSESDCEKGRLIPSGTGTGLWAGMFAALEASTRDGVIRPEDVVGIDMDHVLFYADHASDERVPAKPTDEDLVKSLDLVTLDYAEDYEYERGYSLFEINPAWRTAQEEARDCDWRDLCVHWMVAESYQEKADMEFQRCTERFPDNPTCDAFAHEDEAGDGEPESSRECRERDERLHGNCALTASEPSLVDAHDGLATRIEIQLGKSFADATL